MCDYDYEKRIVYISSDNCKSLSDTQFIKSFDMVDVIKDVSCIKLIKSEIALTSDANGKLLINDSIITNDDPIFINVNNYDRILTSVYNSNNDESSVFKFFDKIHMNLNDKFVSNSPPANTSVYFKNASSTHTFGPCNSDIYILRNDNTIRRFVISLHDKNNQIIKKNDVDKFTFEICLYFSRKKVSQF